ncbi:hypothetical protein X734_04370 [Mesorhizobium sp. L2C084A000]|nr:hypothetical protein X734_04370 [Mesorhizobium sp. L2C084A000]
MPGLLKAFGVIVGKKIDAQVILHMLRIQATQVYHDPLRAGINDVHELSKTHEAIARAKTEIQHRILTTTCRCIFPRSIASGGTAAAIGSLPSSMPFRPQQASRR